MDSAQRVTRAGLLLAAVVLALGAVPGQGQLPLGGGYTVYDEVTLPDTTLVIDDTDLPQNPNRVDVKAIGMGRTQVANGRGYNAMMDNPALLSKKRFSIDLLGVQASIPQATLDAATFVKDNQDQFSSGDFYAQIRDGYEAYGDATSPAARIEAIRQIREGLVFPNQMLEETVGRQNDPNTHGVNVIPNLQAQWGSWGLSLYGSGQIGFQVSPGNSIDTLLSVEIPEGTERLTPEVLRTLGGVVNSVFNADGSLDVDGLPQVFALTYFDVVGAVGYAREVKPGLDVGANLKVIHRRFSTKNIDADNLDNILTEAREDLDESVTGATVDLGALYRYGSRGTQFGLAVQNLIPVKKIASTATFGSFANEQYYLTDDAGEPLVGVVNPQDGEFVPYAGGDTLLYIENQKVNLEAPFRLKAPLLVNAGVWHPVMANWDVSADWVDILAQDDGHDGYVSRFHLGTEYRLLKSMVALRGGVAEKNLTLGAGLNVKVLQVDVAYAHDNFVGDNAYFVQLKLGW